jgi:hypothetical protein
VPEVGTGRITRLDQLRSTSAGRSTSAACPWPRKGRALLGLSPPWHYRRRHEDRLTSPAYDGVPSVTAWCHAGGNGDQTTVAAVNRMVPRSAPPGRIQPRRSFRRHCATSRAASRVRPRAAPLIGMRQRGGARLRSCASSPRTWRGFRRVCARPAAVAGARGADRLPGSQEAAGGGLLPRRRSASRGPGRELRRRRSRAPWSSTALRRRLGEVGELIARRLPGRDHRPPPRAERGDLRCRSDRRTGRRHLYRAGGLYRERAVTPDPLTAHRCRWGSTRTPAD